MLKENKKFKAYIMGYIIVMVLAILDSLWIGVSIPSSRIHKVFLPVLVLFTMILHIKKSAREQMAEKKIRKMKIIWVCCYVLLVVVIIAGGIR